MAQLLVRNLDDALKERLRVVAASHGHSMEEEVRLILHNALAAEVVHGSAESHIGVAARIQALLVDNPFPEEYFEALDEIRHGSEFIDVTARSPDFSSPEYDR